MPAVLAGVQRMHAHASVSGSFPLGGKIGTRKYLIHIAFRFTAPARGSIQVDIWHSFLSICIYAIKPSFLTILRN